VHARLLSATVVLTLAATAAAYGSGGSRRVVGDCDRSEVRPSTIWISCNNPSLAFARLRWSTFGGPLARAAGVMRVESCPSACLPRAVRRYPVALLFSDARPCPDGRNDYRLVAVAYDSRARPPGNTAKTTPLVLFCPLRDQIGIAPGATTTPSVARVWSAGRRRRPAGRASDRFGASRAPRSRIG